MSDQSGRISGGDADPEVATRLADRKDWIGVMNVLDGALLDVDAKEVRERITADAVFVAQVSGSERVRGALVLAEAGTDHRRNELETGSDTETEPEIEIDAIAVRRRYRDRGIGSTLVDRARRETDRVLVAAFDERVRPFYAALGFRITPIADSRFRGRDTSVQS
jgi:ribosomal protein S18 acetylase RimI-like enzyme